MRALALLLVAATPAAAEGARQVFDCRATLECDGKGECQPSDGAVSFVLAPVSVAADGSGTFTLSADGIDAEAEAAGSLGPFLWSDAEGRPQALLVTGESSLLWHSLDPGSGVSAVRFLSCEVTQ